jgi:hypothetical protein
MPKMALLVATGILALATFARSQNPSEGITRVRDKVAQEVSQLVDRGAATSTTVDVGPVAASEPSPSAEPAAVKLLKAHAVKPSFARADDVEIDLEWMALVSKPIQYKIVFRDAVGVMVYSSEGSISQEAAQSYTWTPSVPAGDFRAKGAASGAVWLDGVEVADLQFSIEPK